MPRENLARLGFSHLKSTKPHLKSTGKLANSGENWRPKLPCIQKPQTLTTPSLMASPTSPIFPRRKNAAPKPRRASQRQSTLSNPACALLLAGTCEAADHICTPRPAVMRRRRDHGAQRVVTRMGGDLQGLRSLATRAWPAPPGCADALELIVEKRLQNCNNAKNLAQIICFPLSSRCPLQPPPQKFRPAIVAARLPACLILTWRFHDAITLISWPFLSFLTIPPTSRPAANRLLAHSTA